MNTRFKKILSGGLIGSAVLVMAACLMPVGDGEGLDKNGNVVPAVVDTNFAFVADAVFKVAGCTGCHGAGGFPTGDPLQLSSALGAQNTLFPAGANRLTTTATDQNPRWRVYRTSDSTGVADSSFLYIKVLASSTLKNGSHMPLGRPALSADQVKIIRRWIEKGAKF